MFFHTYILTKRGPFAKIWLAAHWDRKLTKNDVKLIDLSQTVVQIIEPTVPIALRTSGELMLGVVRVYGHKVRFLLKECVEVTADLLRVVPNAPLKSIALHDANGGVKDLQLGAKEYLPNGKRTTKVDSAAVGSITHMDSAYPDLLSTTSGGAGLAFHAIADMLQLGGSGHALEDDLLTLLHPGSGKRPREGEDDWFLPLSHLPAHEEFGDDGTGGEWQRGARREGSQPSSEHSKKSGTSSSKSIEQLRASTLAGGRTGSRGQAVSEVDLLMDLPMPGPDEPPMEGLALPGWMPVNPADWVDRALFPLPDADAGGEMLPESNVPLEQTPSLGKAPSKRARTSLNIVDAAHTVIPAETYHRTMQNYSDQLAQRRHGPRSEADMHHLSILHEQAVGLFVAQSGATDVAARKRNGFSSEPWPAMEGVFRSLSEKLSVRSGHAEVRSLSAWGIEAPRASTLRTESGAGGVEEEAMLPPHHDPTLPMNDFLPPPSFDELAPIGEYAVGERDELRGAPLPITASNRERLDHLETVLKQHASRSKVSVFRTTMKGNRRDAVARAFGDMLTLATMERIRVRQDVPYGDIFVSLA